MSFLTPAALRGNQMNKVSVEVINGQPATVIRKKFDAEAVRKQLSMGVPVVVEYSREGILLREVVTQQTMTEPVFAFDSEKKIHYVERDRRFDNTVTILPPLPRHPSGPEDAALLYRYAAEGLFAVIRYGGEESPFVGCEYGPTPRLVLPYDSAHGEYVLAPQAFNECEITHCVIYGANSEGKGLANGARMEVAITEAGAV